VSLTQPAPPPAPGSSPTARAFDADVSVGESGPTLFYVVARDGTPDAAVRSAGGTVISHLTSTRQALALAPLAAHAALRVHPDLELAGPVAVDAERFGRFARLVGLGEHLPPKTASQPVHTHTQTGEIR
jgi:hypothetical protein